MYLYFLKNQESRAAKQYFWLPFPSLKKLVFLSVIDPPGLLPACYLSSPIQNRFVEKMFASLGCKVWCLAIVLTYREREREKYLMDLRHLLFSDKIETERQYMITLLLEYLHVLHNISLLSTKYISELEFSVFLFRLGRYTYSDTYCNTFKANHCSCIIAGKQLSPTSEDWTTDALVLVASIIETSVFRKRAIYLWKTLE